MYQKIILLCCSFIFLLGCKKDDPTLIVDIDEDFYIDMFEDISNNDRKFQINITTIKAESCLDSQIDHDLDYNEQSNIIELTINDLIEPEDCQQGTSFASSVVPFGRLSEGVYTFEINLKDAVINKGNLEVHNNRYEMNMESDDGIKIVNETLYRIPTKTIWGYVAYDENSTATDANNFIEDLKSMGSIFEVENNSLFIPGYYGYFNLDDDKNLLISEEINNTYHSTFIFQYSSDDLQDVRDVMNSACSNSADDLLISIFVEDGSSFSCP